MKKLFSIFGVVLIILCISGCTKKSETINTNSKLAAAKKAMTENLNNYSYDVKLITKTGFMDITTNMNCKDDRRNKISYCKTSTYGVNTEEYIDYNNKKTYSKVTVAFGGDSSNGKWTSTKYSGENTNSWINLNDYVFNLKEENKNGGTYYTGTIDSKKLASAVSQIDTDVDTSNVVSDDINISVFVNSSNYIENMSFVMEIMGIEMEVEITYKDFNKTGDIKIPAEAK